MATRRLWRLAGAGLAAAWLWPAQALGVREPTALLVRGDAQAESTGRVTPPMPLQLLRREGFWVEVQAPSSRGWLKASTLNFGGATTGAVALDTGRLAGGAIVASSAARGLSPHELLLARPDRTALQGMAGWAVDRAQLDRFLVEGTLQPGPTARWRLALPEPGATPPPARVRAPEAGW